MAAPTTTAEERPRTGISAAELAARRERLREHVRREGLAGWVLFDQHYIRYLTGFVFLATERPVAVAADADGALIVFVPEFEVERVREEAAFERIESYPEYPGVEHPMRILGRVLADAGIRGAVGADQDGYPGILGYQGPSLGEVTGARVAPLGSLLEGMMARKSAEEIALIRESGRWCGHAHRLLQEHTRAGATEAEASLRAGHDATLAMLEALGPSIGQQSSSDGATAGYRGQIGRRSAWAHAVAHTIEFADGDVLVSETSAPVWGYNAELERAMVVGRPTDEVRRRFAPAAANTAELERAMVVGRPTDEVRRLFAHAVAAQDVAFAALRPGVTCADVDGAVLRYFEEQGILPLWKQHTGHAIGLRNHEAPFLDVGDSTVVEPGMVFTIEPGVYAPGVGGFRHSDTVAVTEDGIEILTDYPRDLESLTVG